jgi:hypothetical protein
MADDRTRTQTQDAEVAAEALAPGLIVVHHEDPRFIGAVAVPTSRAALELGRDSADFVPGALDDSRVSRRHASIRRRGDRLHVVDRGSHNGTFVNGERVSEAELLSGDVLAVGPVLMLARPVGDSPAARPHPRFVGTSGKLAAVLRLVERAADRDLTVLRRGALSALRPCLLQKFLGSGLGWRATSSEPGWWPTMRMSPCSPRNSALPETPSTAGFVETASIWPNYVIRDSPGR